MFVSAKTKRFNLYHMEQGQTYIKDFYGACTLFDLVTNQERVKDKGKFYICSKSIVYESDNKNISLMKYRFQNMKQLPNFSSQGVKFRIGRITTIRVIGNSPPQPFRVFEDINEKIDIYPTYQNIRELKQWVTFLFENSRVKNNYDLEEKIYAMIIQKFNKRTFNMSLIESVSEKAMLEQSNILTRQVLPLTHIYGYFFMTSEKVYFEPFHNLSSEQVYKIDIKKIAKLFKRRYQLRQIGLQIITSKGKSYYYTFENQSFRNRIFSVLSKKVPADCIRLQSLEKITFLWQNKQVSNYEYLMHLNQAGNRSFSDLSQYPVFPWVLTNYQDEELNLDDQKNYRDLSKPIGALNPQRLQSIMNRYQYMQPPKFMYGSHYSTPGYVIGYLVRTKPQYMLKLQSGKFDKPDRLFKSIKDDWKNVFQNPTSLKQLIPEFYQDDTSFLKNSMNLDLGVRQNKKRVSDVKLPKWAKENYDYFLQTTRRALQSEYVSNNLHNWIDLIFGYKQRGQQAIKAYNLFHHLTYEGMVDIERIKDPIQRIGLKCQINQFGQCPKQLFKIPHPPRYSTQPINLTIQQLHNLEAQQDDQKQLQFKSPPIKQHSINHVEVSSLYSNGVPKVKTVLSMGKQTDIKKDQISRAHKSQIVRAIHLSSKTNSLLTIGHDGFLKIFDVYSKTCLKSFKICDFHLSSVVVLKQDDTFAIGSWDNNIYLFNIVYGSKSKPFPAHDNSINDLVYMPKRKMLVSGAWDCSVKSFRFFGSNLDQEQLFYDHENQISSLAVNEDQNLVGFGDIEGNVYCVSVDEKEVIFKLNMNSQKITRMDFIQSNLAVAAETEIRLIDLQGSELTSYLVSKNNGIITDMCLEGEHMYITTTKKQLILFDILQQKKIGNFYNDFTVYIDDRLPEEKQLTCVASGNNGLFVAVGGFSGNLYLLRT